MAEEVKIDIDERKFNRIMQELTRIADALEAQNRDKEKPKPLNPMKTPHAVPPTGSRGRLNSTS